MLPNCKFIQRMTLVNYSQNKSVFQKTYLVSLFINTYQNNRDLPERKRWTASFPLVMLNCVPRVPRQSPAQRRCLRTRRHTAGASAHAHTGGNRYTSARTQCVLRSEQKPFFAESGMILWDDLVLWSTDASWRKNAIILFWTAHHVHIFLLFSLVHNYMLNECDSIPVTMEKHFLRHYKTYAFLIHYFRILVFAI